MTELLIRRNERVSVSRDPGYGNRYGMIAGAIGTGRSVSPITVAEGFSRLGEPCFLADAKGNFAGLSMAAAEQDDKLKARLATLKLTHWKKTQADRLTFWGIHGELGRSIRATVREMALTLPGKIGREILCGAIGGIFGGRR